MLLRKAPRRPQNKIPTWRRAHLEEPAQAPVDSETLWGRNQGNIKILVIAMMMRYLMEKNWRSDCYQCGITCDMVSETVGHLFHAFSWRMRDVFYSSPGSTYPFVYKTINVSLWPWGNGRKCRQEPDWTVTNACLLMIDFSLQFRKNLRLIFSIWQ